MKKWIKYNDKNKIGSENGLIVLDQLYDNSSRITIEKINKYSYAITCGIDGFTCHTTFANDKKSAFKICSQMKKEIVDFLNMPNITEEKALIWLKNFTSKW